MTKQKNYRRIEKDVELYSSNLVFQEATTVISKRMGMVHAKRFFEAINKFVSFVVIVDTDIEGKSWKIFLKQTKKGAPFIDCSNLAVIEKYKLDGILTFDRFYPKELIKT